MSKGISAGQGAMVASAIAAVGLGAFLLAPRDLNEVPLTRDATETTRDPQPIEEAADRIIPQPADDPVLPKAPITPELDVIRIDARGAAVIAGKGGAGIDVILRLDGQEIATAKTDADGNFVSLFDMGVAESPRILTVETLDASGQLARAADSIIVAPTFPKIAEPDVVPDVVVDAAPDIPVAPDTADAQISEPSTPPTIAGLPELEVTEPLAPLDEPVEEPTSVDVAAAAPVAPRLFRAGPAGVTVLSDGGTPPTVAADLGIDAITYDEVGDVQLAGRGASDSQLRIYLDNEPVQLTRVDEGGAWTSPLPDVQTGVYTLRIDALDADGAVTTRIETPFQRTAPEIAAAARAEGVTALTVQPGWTLWAISEGYFGDGVRYVQIFEANREAIRDPNLIFPGQVFNLPEATQ